MKAARSRGSSPVAGIGIDKRKIVRRRPQTASRLPHAHLSPWRLAVDQRAQGHGIAQALLRAVFDLAHKMSTELGCVGVVVDAKPEAAGFYRKLGFVELEMTGGLLGDRPQPQPMFLELGAIPKG